MKVYCFSEALKKKRSQKTQIPDYIKIKETFTQIAIESIRPGENPWWLTEEDKIKYNHLLKDKPWLKAVVH